MPYFKWRGIDISGDGCSGKMFARSKKELDGFLFDREIAMLSCSDLKPLLLFSSIGLAEKIDFFRQLSVLLRAGVMVPQGLHILSKIIGNIRLRTIICSVTSSVLEGLTLSKALEDHPEVFDFLTIKMIRIGQETGRLHYALEQLCDYLDAARIFKKKLKSLALIPCITFGFFLLIATVIFVVIIPRFQAMFSSMNKELPPITKIVVSISEALRSGTVLWVLVGIIILVVAIRLYFKTIQGKETFDRFIMHVPWLGDLIKNSSLVYFLHSVSMLFGSGVRLLKSMNISNKSIKNSVLKKHVDQLQEDVAAGMLLSQSMKGIPSSFFEDDLIALAKVGEESGNLGPMLKKGADIYQEKVNRSIAFFTTIFQPLLMIVLGLLITLLVFAIYLPVFNLANVI